MHAVVVYALISPRMLLVEMRRRRTNATRHEGPEGALLFLRATITVGNERGGNKFPREVLY
jgi:hypothetical protein